MCISVYISNACISNFWLKVHYQGALSSSLGDTPNRVSHGCGRRTWVSLAVTFFIVMLATGYSVRGVRRLDASCRKHDMFNNELAKLRAELSCLKHDIKLLLRRNQSVMMPVGVCSNEDAETVNEFIRTTCFKQPSVVAPKAPQIQRELSFCIATPPLDVDAEVFDSIIDDDEIELYNQPCSASLRDADEVLEWDHHLASVGTKVDCTTELSLMGLNDTTKEADMLSDVLPRS